jgi:SAM-dependent methyltransferase
MPTAVPAHQMTGETGAPPGRRSLIIARSIARDWHCRLLGGARQALLAPRPLTETIDHIDAAYRDYLYHGNLSPEDLRGARVLQLDPDDHLGVALQMLAAGAGEVTALERFVHRNGHPGGAVFRFLRDRARGQQRHNIETAVSFDNGIRINPARLRILDGTPIERADRVLPEHSFQLIVSRGALGRISDLDRAFAALDRLLAPGGRMLHKLDLSDGGLFSGQGLHPLEFLTVPEPVYHLMSAHSGLPNRRRIDYYGRKMRELGYFAGLLVTRVAGVEPEIVPHRPSLEGGETWFPQAQALVGRIRPRLARPFRDLPDEDLMVAGVFLVAQKPA